MENLFQVWWRGSQVGKFEVTATDMWYEDGNWYADISPEARLFEDLILTFVVSEVMKSPEKGTRIVLRTNDFSLVGNALVIGLEKNTLMIRRFFDEEAVQWLVKNVH